jgi:hypothetical protein
VSWRACAGAMVVAAPAAAASSQSLLPHLPEHEPRERCTNAESNFITLRSYIKYMRLSHLSNIYIYMNVKIHVYKS